MKRTSGCAGLIAVSWAEKSLSPSEYFKSLTTRPPIDEVLAERVREADAVVAAGVDEDAAVCAFRLFRAKTASTFPW